MRPTDLIRYIVYNKLQKGSISTLGTLTWPWFQTIGQIFSPPHLRQHVECAQLTGPDIPFRNNSEGPVTLLEDIRNQLEGPWIGWAPSHEYWRLSLLSVVTHARRWRGMYSNRSAYSWKRLILSPRPINTNLGSLNNHSSPTLDLAGPFVGLWVSTWWK